VEALDRRRLELKNRYVAASRSYVFREPANIVDRARRQLEGLQTRMRHQLVGELNRIQQQLDEFSLRATHHVKTACATRRQDLRRLSAQLAAFNPHAVLQRGYSVTRTADGTILRTTKDVRKGDPIVTQLAKGTLESEVKKTSSEEEE
jgi:exodeoxyribonuclease VII large subunit